VPHVFPTYSVGERRADAFIHVLGVSASIAGALTLMVMAAGALPSAGSVASLAIYSAGMMAVFGFSAAYHLVTWPPVKAVLRRFDHAAIYLAIAATYTPFAAVMGGAAGYGLLALVWSVAAFGVVMKLRFPKRLVRTSYVLYLAQGWAVVLALGPLAAAVSDRVLILLGIGGVLYTVGVVFHLWNGLRYHNAVWHGFVLVAAGCHYAAVMSAVYV